MMMGESDAMYRDPDKFSSSESEGEEENSVMMDEGMNSLDDMQAYQFQLKSHLQQVVTCDAMTSYARNEMRAPLRLGPIPRLRLRPRD